MSKLLYFLSLSIVFIFLASSGFLALVFGIPCFLFLVVRYLSVQDTILDKVLDISIFLVLGLNWLLYSHLIVIDNSLIANNLSKFLTISVWILAGITLYFFIKSSIKNKDIWKKLGIFAVGLVISYPALITTNQTFGYLFSCSNFYSTQNYSDYKFNTPNFSNCLK